METLTTPSAIDYRIPKRTFAAGMLKTALMITLIVLVTGAAFWRVWLGSLLGTGSYDFVEWDDPQTIAANPDFNPPNVTHLLRYWRAPYLDLYIPMTYTAWTGIAE